MSISLRDFETGAVHHAPFGHRDHVRIAYELIVSQPFDVALARFVGALRNITSAAGHPGKFHMTITVAFLAAIAERHARDPALTWEEFASRNPDLLDKAVLGQWYGKGELESDIARATFVLPMLTTR